MMVQTPRGRALIHRLAAAPDAGLSACWPRDVARAEWRPQI